MHTQEPKHKSHAFGEGDDGQLVAAAPQTPSAPPGPDGRLPVLGGRGSGQRCRQAGLGGRPALEISC